jgi:hypothetical protein
MAMLIVGEPRKRKLASWIESFVKYTKNTPTTELFCSWSGVATISGALQRKVFTTTYDRRTYPNLYVFLIGPPGEGKSVAIDEAKEIYKLLPPGRLVTAPNSGSRQQFYKRMASSFTIVQDNNNKTLTSYSGVHAAIGELRTWLRDGDADFQSDLNAFYDCEAQWSHSIKGKTTFQSEEKTKDGKGEEDMIKFPCLTIVGGLTPVGFRAVLDERAFDDGLGARIIPVYDERRRALMEKQRSEGKLVQDPFETLTSVEARQKLYGDLVYDLQVITELCGEYVFTNEAKDEFRRFELEGHLTEPNEPRLMSYNLRRPRHLIKLAQIRAADTRNELCILPEDIIWAEDFLVKTEFTMPKALEVFGNNPLQKAMEQVVAKLGKMYKDTLAKDHKAIGVIETAFKHGILQEIDPRWRDTIILSLIEADIIRVHTSVYGIRFYVPTKFLGPQHTGIAWGGHKGTPT